LGQRNPGRGGALYFGWGTREMNGVSWEAATGKTGDGSITV